MEFGKGDKLNSQNDATELRGAMGNWRRQIYIQSQWEIESYLSPRGLSDLSTVAQPYRHMRGRPRAFPRYSCVTSNDKCTVLEKHLPDSGSGH